ncbi:MAG: hypothetical protein IH991_18665 [Planctomycetes bacterium]|nr:hypothetical protein [Planctomycetota bacterium]
MPDSRDKRRWYQFSLRTMMIAVFLTYAAEEISAASLLWDHSNLQWSKKCEPHYTAISSVRNGFFRN